MARLRRDVGKRSTAGRHLHRPPRRRRPSRRQPASAEPTPGSCSARTSSWRATPWPPGTAPTPTATGSPGGCNYRKEGDRWRWRVTSGAEADRRDVHFRRSASCDVPASQRGRRVVCHFARARSRSTLVRQFFFSADRQLYAKPGWRTPASERHASWIKEAGHSGTLKPSSRAAIASRRTYDNGLFVRLTEEFEIFDGVDHPPGRLRQHRRFEVEFADVAVPPGLGFRSSRGPATSTAGPARAARCRCGCAVQQARRAGHQLPGTTGCVFPFGDFDTNLWVTRVQVRVHAGGCSDRRWSSGTIVTDDVDLNRPARLDPHIPAPTCSSSTTSRLQHRPWLPDEPRTNFRQGIVKLTWLFHF